MSFYYFAGTGVTLDCNRCTQLVHYAGVVNLFNQLLIIGESSEFQPLLHNNCLLAMLILRTYALYGRMVLVLILTMLAGMYCLFLTLVGSII